MQNPLLRLANSIGLDYVVDKIPNGDAPTIISVDPTHIWLSNMVRYYHMIIIHDTNLLALF